MILRGPKEKGNHVPFLQYSVIYNHEFLQHPTYIVRPGILYLAQNGGDSFLSRVDFGSDDAVPLQILNYGREIFEVFVDVEIFSFVIIVQEPFFREIASILIVCGKDTHPWFL